MNIEICNYTKKLSKNLVLENINLSLSGGKIYGFVGKNGSGKTMLMRAICGLILPTSGFVKINKKIIGQWLLLSGSHDPLPIKYDEHRLFSRDRPSNL